MPFNYDKIHAFQSNWTEVAGVYGVLDESNTVIYIGQTDNLKRRHSEHCKDVDHLMHKNKPTSLIFEFVKDSEMRTRREGELIHEYNPRCNQKI